MTIEAKLDETNTLLRQIIAQMARNSVAAPAEKPAPAAEDDAARRALQAGRTKPAAKAPPAAQEAPQQPAEALTYEKDVKPAVLQVSAVKGRDACVALLAKFGLATAKEAKPEQYAELVAACTEALK